MNRAHALLSCACVAMAAFMTGCGNRHAKDTVWKTWTAPSPDSQYRVDYRFYTSKLGDTELTKHGFDVRSSTGRRHGGVVFMTGLADIPDTAVDETTITWTSDGREVIISIGKRRYSIDLATGKHTDTEPQHLPGR